MSLRRRTQRRPCLLPRTSRLPDLRARLWLLLRWTRRRVRRRRRSRPRYAVDRNAVRYAVERIRSQCCEWFGLVVRLGAPYLPREQKRAVAVVWRDSLARRRKEAVPAAAALSRGAIQERERWKNTLKITQIQKQIPAIAGVQCVARCCVYT